MSSDRLVHLKIKLVNLADEARTIRKEERKALLAHRKAHAVEVDRPVRSDPRDLGLGVKPPPPTRRELVYRLRPEDAGCPAYKSLHDHRIGVVRTAARENHLAYGFLRGVPYEVMEPNPDLLDRNRRPSFDEVFKIASRFGGIKPDTEPYVAWQAWRAAAEAHQESVTKARHARLAQRATGEAA